MDPAKASTVIKLYATLLRKFEMLGKSSTAQTFLVLNVATRQNGSRPTLA